MKEEERRGGGIYKGADTKELRLSLSLSLTAVESD